MFNTKKIRIYSLILFSFFLSIWFCFSYEHQWFSKYEELDEEISFVCEGQCNIVLWKKNDIKYTELSWTIYSDWIAGIEYWYLEWNKLSFLDCGQNYITKHSQIRDSFEFIDCDKYRDIPIYSDIVLIIHGNSNANIEWNIGIYVTYFSIQEKLERIWNNDFLDLETMETYSTMLRRWVLIGWVSIIEYGYAIFILAAIWILIFKKGKRGKILKPIFYVWLWLFLFIWIRNLVSYTSILNEWLYWFKTNQTYFDFGDYFWFVDKVRNKLNLDSREITKDNCKIFMDDNENLKMKHGSVEIYFKPCEIITEWNLADYKIYYKKGIPEEDIDKKILLEFSGSYLLDNNSN